MFYNSMYVFLINCFKDLLFLFGRALDEIGIQPFSFSSKTLYYGYSLESSLMSTDNIGISEQKGANQW